MNEINPMLLENIDIKVIHRAFQDAFSDYAVKLPLSLENFQTMMKRRGFTPDISMGAFTEPDQDLVGFVLNGLRQWQGKLTAYDTGTGVTPAYRKQGITSHLFDEVLDVLKQRGVEQYLLEVLKSNKVAFELYKKQGFTVTRTFSVFKLNKNSVQTTTTEGIDCVPGIALDEWEIVKSFWDFDASWQNSIDSVQAVPEKFVYVLVRRDSEIVGYGIVEKATGDVPQFAVRQDYRRKGIGQGIISTLMQYSQTGELRFVNVDDSCDSCINFLRDVGAEITGGQYEMLLPLT
ncbi:GNAT family N-acetyltransferase [Enterococcus sp. 669A]|uniref:GNAT family N-acetyltransferase n=1 Tax=Candidatus Enterococcus moelleringii TaxID=2815325 RepID=A0ABS3LBW1_9ENTE|nr:GNAT family N-acetyltransferase [Enterococcus sp. 669A]MBO1307118.1 GNAT family N-acetyltransferase [Enterococcus sp. 669A]